MHKRSNIRSIRKASRGGVVLPAFEHAVSYTSCEYAETNSVSTMPVLSHVDIYPPSSGRSDQSRAPIITSGTPASRYTKALRFCPAIPPPLEKLAVYILHPPISLDRLSLGWTKRYGGLSTLGPHRATRCSPTTLHTKTLWIYWTLLPLTSPIKDSNWFAISAGTPTKARSAK
jgi:hypothetical protein